MFTNKFMIFNIAFVTIRLHGCVAQMERAVIFFETNYYDLSDGGRWFKSNHN